MIKKNENEKKAAIKLLNKYAESYHTLEVNNMNLKRENEDLKSNLRINKEIIQSFFQGANLEQKVSIFLNKTKEENSMLTKKIIALEKEISNLNKLSKEIPKYKEEIENYKTKNFLLENLITEKENEVLKFSQSSKSSARKNEVFITQPGKVVNRLNSQLENLREENSKLNNKLKTVKTTIAKKEKTIQEYEIQLMKYRQEISSYKQMKNNSNIISQLTQYKMSFVGTSPITRLNKSSISPSILNIEEMNREKSKSKRSVMSQIEKLEKQNKSKKSKIYENFDLTEEWYETLKHCGLSQEEYVKYCNNKQYVKLTDVTEYLYKLIIDKNIQIKLLTEENDSLNSDNLKLNKINIELMDEVQGIKEKIHNSKDNSTFVNVDTSINNLENKFNLNLMMDYLKEVQQSITSSEFQEGMVLDQFELESQMSKENSKSNGAVDVK